MSSTTRDQLSRLLRESEFSAYADTLMALAAPSIRIRTRRGQPSLGQSRFGGEPDLPTDVAWPLDDGRPLEFLCQINFAEVQRFHQSDALPSSGWLYLFYNMDRGVWGFDPADRSGWQVLYLESDRHLVRCPAPSDVCGDWRFPVSVLDFETEWTLPGLDLTDFPDDLAKHLCGAESRLERYRDLFQNLDLRLNQHRLLGHAQPNQSDMRLECQLVSNGVYCGGGGDDPRRSILEEGARDWGLLLQIDTDDTEGNGPGWMWGDAGRLYVLIRDNDLKERRFERAWLVLQCG